MSILRNSAILLQRTEATAGPIDSGPRRLRPVDGDGIADHQQRMYLFLFVEKVGQGTVELDLMGSFGDGLWAIFQTIPLTDDGPSYGLGLIAADEVPPYLRALVRTTAPTVGPNVPPTARVTVRVASNAPFTLAPASVPITTVRAITPQVEGNGSAGSQGGD